MVGVTTVPAIGSGKASTKNVIISILSEEWPLSVREIFSRVQKNGNGSISYQAIHKTLQTLESEEIVKRNEKGFTLNPSWIKNIRSFGEQLDKSYSLNSYQRVIIDFNKPLQSFTFNNYLEMLRFTIHFFVDCPNQENKLGVCRCYHAWCPMNVSNEEYKKLKQLFAETKFYEIIAHDTPLDQMFAGLLRDLGKTIKLGIECSKECDTVVKGDFVYQVYFPNDLKSILSKIYKDTQKIEELEMNKLFKNVLEKETKIKVVIIKDSSLAEQIREDTLKYFNGVSNSS